MAASTTMPTAKKSPANEITLSDRPSAFMPTKVPITETGIASEMTMVAATERRNTNRTRAARMPPI